MLAERLYLMGIVVCFIAVLIAMQVLTTR